MSFSDLQEMGKPVAIKDEGLTLVTSVGSIDFRGSGVTGSAIGAAVTEDIPGGISSIAIGTPITGSTPGLLLLADLSGNLGQIAGAGTANYVLTSNGSGALPTFKPAAASGGTVTSVSVVTENGVSGSVATATTTPAITLTLGAITPTTVNGLTISSTTGTFTLTNAKVLAVTNTLTLSGTDSTVMTFPSTTATIARTDAGQTFTGVQVMTSPSITTSLTTGSSTFGLLPATATTINFAGASGAVVNLGGGANAAELRFLEPSGSGTNYSAFKAVAQGADITYSLPATVGAAGTVLTDAAGNGVLSWAAAGGFAYGASVSGTTADGLTITLSNSSNDAAGALKLIAGDTQSNQPVLANLQLGTSANVMGLLIQGTGSTTGGAAGTGKNHLTLWGNTASSTVRVLSVGNGTSYTEKANILASGGATFGVLAINATTTLAYTPTAGNARFQLNYNSMGTVNGADLFNIDSTTIQDYSSASIISATAATTAIVTGRTVGSYLFIDKRTRSATSLSITDNYDHAYFKRESITTGAGGTLLAQGSVAKFENVATQTAGTLTDTVVVGKFIQDVDSTGDVLQLINNATVNLAFSSVGNLCLGVATAGATAANGVLCLGNGATAPSTTVDRTHLYSVDITAGHASLGIFTEEVTGAETALTADTSLNIKVNGTTYKLLLHT